MTTMYIHPKCNQSQPNLILNQHTVTYNKNVTCFMKKTMSLIINQFFVLKVKWSVEQFHDKSCYVGVNFISRTCTIIRNPNKDKGKKNNVRAD